MSTKDITIVITSFKSDKIIRNCLNSIDRQYRVILVENSNDFELKKNVPIWKWAILKDGKKVFAMTGHTHQYGTNVEVKFGNSIDDEDPISVYPPEGLVFDWAEAPVAQYEPALSFTEGQGFFYRCTWDNTSDKKLTFGESATDEMCFFWAYYYPSDGYRFCINPGSYADQASSFGLSNIPEQLCCPEHALCSLLPLLIGNL